MRTIPLFFGLILSACLPQTQPKNTTAVPLPAEEPPPIVEAPPPDPGPAVYREISGSIDDTGYTDWPHPPSHLADGNLGTYWENMLLPGETDRYPSSVNLDFTLAETVILGKVVLYNIDDHFEISSSEDGETWTMLYGCGCKSDAQEMLFNGWVPGGRIKAKYVRVNVFNLDTYHGKPFTISEVKFFEVSGGQ